MPEHNVVLPAKPDTNILDLAATAQSLKSLSQAVEQLPSRTAAEMDLARSSLHMGLVVGLVVGVLGAWLLAVLITRKGG